MLHRISFFESYFVILESVSKSMQGVRLIFLSLRSAFVSFSSEVPCWTLQPAAARNSSPYMTWSLTAPLWPPRDTTPSSTTCCAIQTPGRTPEVRRSTRPRSPTRPWAPRDGFLLPVSTKYLSLKLLFRVVQINLNYSYFFCFVFFFDKLEQNIRYILIN